MRKALTSDGSTHACAVLVIELAIPTTLSFGLPGTDVTVILAPRPGKKPSPSDSTI